MYIEGLFCKLAKVCAILAVIFGLWAVLALIIALTESNFVFNLPTFLVVFLPIVAFPVLFGILAFSLRRITREIADEQRATADAIKELNRKIRALDK